MRQCSIILAVVMFGSGCAVGADTVTLVRDGRAQCSVVVPTDVLNVADQEKPDPDSQALRAAADDVATYLQRMSGAQIAITDKPVEGMLPIHVGGRALGITGSGMPTSELGDAYAVHVQGDGIALLGESSRAVHYAAARLLHQLGVRWYALGELGEHVPSRRTITVEIGTETSAPDYRTRHVWGHEPRGGIWVRRNRMDGPVQAQGHAFAAFLENGRHFDDHPDWYPVVNGKPVRHNANLSNPEVLELFVRKVREQFERGAKWVCIGPDDGVFLDERPASRAMDSGRIDPIMKVPSSTDKLVLFGNRIAEQLEDEFGDRRLTFYVYGNHQIAPTIEPHPMIMPIIGPINYSRYASTGNPRSPISMMLKAHIDGWAEACDEMGFYLYDFNLADLVMPYTRTAYWRKEIPNYHKWGATDATIQAIGNWHARVPGAWVSANLLWDVDTDVDALLDDFYPNYYGRAADAMRRYDGILEQAYENSAAFAGNLWSMHLILTPEVMRELNASLGEAEKQARGDELRARRVNLARRSLTLAKTYFAARDALNEFRLSDAAGHSVRFQEAFKQADAAFPGYYHPDGLRYWNLFHDKSYADAGRVASEGEVVYRLPDELNAFLDEGQVGDEMGLWHPQSDTSNWITLRTHGVALDEQGHPFFRGLIWYRHDFELPADVPDTARLMLWMGGLDGPTRVYLNGQDLGRQRVSNFNPAEVEITAAIRRDGPNVLVIASDNTFVNELGTGGIMRPVLIHAPHEAPADPQPTAEPSDDEPRSTQPLHGG